MQEKDSESPQDLSYRERVFPAQNPQNPAPGFDRDLGDPPNPNCILNAVAGATELARPFGNVGPTGIIGHDGVHVVAPAGSQVTTLPALTGTVLGRPRKQGDGLFSQDVLLDGGNVAIYKDLATVSVRPGQRLRTGSVIGTVGEGGDYAGLHFTLLRGSRNERNYYRSLTSTGQSNKIKVGMFINPLGPNSPRKLSGRARKQRWSKPLIHRKEMLKMRFLAFDDGAEPFFRRFALKTREHSTRRQTCPPL